MSTVVTVCTIMYHIKLLDACVCVICIVQTLKKKKKIYICFGFNIIFIVNYFFMVLLKCV